MAAERSSRGEAKGAGKRFPFWLGVGALASLLAVFALVVAFVTLALRADIRSQLMAVDSHVLNLLVRNQIERAAEEQLLFEFEELGEEDVWIALLETAGAEGVFAIQLYSREGLPLRSSSESLVEAPLAAETMAAMEEGEAYTDFHASAWLSDFVEIGYEADRRISAIDVYVPLSTRRSPGRLGVARYLLDGSVLAREYALLDRRLARQAGVAVGIGGVAMVGLFGLAWRRLARANQRALEQSRRLGRANQELAMLARTSAVGSVAAHLIHGLKNPLAGLREVVAAQSGGTATLDEEDWKGAREAAERMQSMVQEVVGLLQDSASGTSYEVTLEEVGAALRSRFSVRAEAASVGFALEVSGDATLPSHRSNILTLIVSNLLENALDAAGAGGRVTARLSIEGDDVAARVSDDGPGIAADRRDALFAPVNSSKSGGAGIGLAISAQLSRHLGGTLDYLDTEGAGAVFELRAPANDRSERSELS